MHVKALGFEKHRTFRSLLQVSTSLKLTFSHLKNWWLKKPSQCPFKKCSLFWTEHVMFHGAGVYVWLTEPPLDLERAVVVDLDGGEFWRIPLPRTPYFGSKLVPFFFTKNGSSLAFSTQHGTWIPPFEEEVRHLQIVKFQVPDRQSIFLNMSTQYKVNGGIWKMACCLVSSLVSVSCSSWCTGTGRYTYLKYPIVHCPYGEERRNLSSHAWFWFDASHIP